MSREADTCDIYHINGYRSMTVGNIIVSVCWRNILKPPICLGDACEPWNSSSINFLSLSPPMAECKAYKMKTRCSLRTINSLIFHKILEIMCKKTTILSSSQAGQRILCNNTTTINTQANCQRLITSHLCHDGADEIILPSFYIWPSGALTSSLMRFNFRRQGEV